ncbi:PH domain-containing protein [Hymenobacter sp. BT507]|uniref:PH domain-containing protein n=1 Tax=Hymenobacter citatus TaxID=2763506 RepID=A0ABR7MFG4_9BACT|nr:PH domain-containing protein [Hymenobacter citatus]MBC6609826.1 PH domain-containing protein [Hymenobacter citatus]
MSPALPRVFVSKISWWLFGSILLVQVAISIMAIADGAYVVPVFMLPSLAFMIWLLRSTYYEVQPQTQMLRVVSGPLTWQIPVTSITRIKPSHNVLSSPALSLDRLKISYNRYDEILVSPRDKADFMEALRQLNPQIQVG